MSTFVLFLSHLVDHLSCLSYWIYSLFSKIKEVLTAVVDNESIKTCLFMLIPNLFSTGRKAYMQYLDTIYKKSDISWFTPVELFKVMFTLVHSGCLVNSLDFRISYLFLWI